MSVGTKMPEARLYAEGLAIGSFSDVSDAADRSENTSLNLLAATMDRVSIKTSHGSGSLGAVANHAPI